MWSWESTAIPPICPITQLFGNVFGQDASTLSFGATFGLCCAALPSAKAVDEFKTAAAPTMAAAIAAVLTYRVHLFMVCSSWVGTSEGRKRARPRPDQRDVAPEYKTVAKKTRGAAAPVRQCYLQA